MTDIDVNASSLLASASGPRPAGAIGSGAIWRHVKGKLYRVICVALDESDKSLRVIYQSVGDDRIWVRPQSEFLTRFELYASNIIPAELLRSDATPPADQDVEALCARLVTELIDAQLKGERAANARAERAEAERDALERVLQEIVDCDDSPAGLFNYDQMEPTLRCESAISAARAALAKRKESKP